MGDVFSPDITLSRPFRLLPFFRTGPDTVVLNPSEPSKEKEKQGFFRAMKKKKKKSQMVTCVFGGKAFARTPSLTHEVSTRRL